MTPEYIALSPEITAAEAIRQLRTLAAEAETIYYLYIVKADETLIGALSLRQLIIAEPETKLEDLMQTRILSVSPEDSDRDVAEIVNKYNLLAIPVVDDNLKMLGIITVDDVLEMLVPDRGSLETFASIFVSKRTMK